MIDMFKTAEDFQQENNLILHEKISSFLNTVSQEWENYSGYFKGTPVNPELIEHFMNWNRLRGVYVEKEEINQRSLENALKDPNISNIPSQENIDKFFFDFSFQFYQGIENMQDPKVVLDKSFGSLVRYLYLNIINIKEQKTFMGDYEDKEEEKPAVDEKPSVINLTVKGKDDSVLKNRVIKIEKQDTNSFNIMIDENDPTEDRIWDSEGQLMLNMRGLNYNRFNALKNNSEPSVLENSVKEKTPTQKEIKLDLGDYLILKKGDITHFRLKDFKYSPLKINKNALKGTRCSIEERISKTQYTKNWDEFKTYFKYNSEESLQNAKAYYHAIAVAKAAGVGKKKVMQVFSNIDDSLKGFINASYDCANTDEVEKSYGIRFAETKQEDGNFYFAKGDNYSDLAGYVIANSELFKKYAKPREVLYALLRDSEKKQGISPVLDEIENLRRDLPSEDFGRKIEDIEKEIKNIGEKLKFPCVASV